MRTKKVMFKIYMLSDIILGFENTPTHLTSSSIKEGKVHTDLYKNKTDRNKKIGERHEEVLE